VTIGACATAGGIQALRNFAEAAEFAAYVYPHPEYLKTLACSTAIAAHVPVDFELRGCPIDKRQLIEVITAFLAGRKPAIPNHSVCMECKARGTVCVMVARGTPCLGPVTQMGCGAICPSYDRGCYGCFGPMPGANTVAIAREFWSLGMVERVRLCIFEPPRFFEALLRGRGFAEAVDIVARICGICPIAYQMSGTQAIEDALGIAVEPAVRALRRLLYCGEWIESHALHIIMLHAPDFLGYPDAMTMARDHRVAVDRGLALKKAGNALLRLLGGREIHPVNVRVGGFYRAPGRAELTALSDGLKRARDQAIATLRWAAGFDFPECRRDYEFIALRHADEYPMNEGRIVSSAGLDIAAVQYETEFLQRQVPYSTALHSALKQRGAYLVGPLARYAINRDRLPAEIRALADEVGLETVCRNPFRSILVRALEVVYACGEALRLIAAYEPPPRPFVPAEPRPATGYGCAEAPRGILYHRYRLDAEGTILDARLVPPTAQNQGVIEEDLNEVAAARLGLGEEALRAACEASIRNHDPCVSCAAHFLQLRVHRT
jgi:coenzyme F420-reducing hydrogenase alpha subunit